MSDNHHELPITKLVLSLIREVLKEAKLSLRSGVVITVVLWVAIIIGFTKCSHWGLS